MSGISPDNHNWSNGELTEEELRHGMEETQRHEDTLKLQLSRPTYGIQSFSDSYQALHRYRINIRNTKAIFRVPNEIWLHIFVQLIPDEPLESLKNRYTICLVCQRWKQLADTLPQAIAAYVIDPANSPQNSQIVNDKGNTFALRLNLFTNDNTRHPSVNNSIEHFSSLSHLSLTYHPIIHGTVNSLIPRNLPHLHTLKLRITEDFTANEGQLAIFNNAEALTNVEIESSIHIRVPFPLNNLIRYREISLDPIRFVYSMAAATKLEELSYNIRNPTLVALAGVTRPTIRINTLKKFEYSIYNGPMQHLNFLKDVRFPNLQSLRIREEHEDIITEIDAFLLNCLTPAMSSLTHLAFHSTPLLDGQLVNLLRKVPNLISLECDAIPNADVRALGTRPNQSADASWYLVPDLNAMIVHDVTDIRVMEDLALARSTLTIKLLFRDPKQRDRLAVYRGAQIPSSLDRMLSAILDEIEVFLAAYPNGDPVPSLGVEVVTKRRINSLLDDLAQVSWPSPQHMRLSLVQSLHWLTLLDLSVVAGLDAYVILKRARGILQKYITIYQLRLPTTREWVTLGRHGLLFEQQETVVEWEPDYPSEYDLLYGKYRAPTREEVFWPFEDCSKFSPGW